MSPAPLAQPDNHRRALNSTGDHPGEYAAPMQAYRAQIKHLQVFDPMGASAWLTPCAPCPSRRTFTHHLKENDMTTPRITMLEDLGKASITITSTPFPIVMDPAHIPAGECVKIYILVATNHHPAHNPNCAYYTDHDQAKQALRWHNKNCGKGHYLLPVLAHAHGAE